MFRSEAHKKKLQELLKDGKVTQKDYERMEKATGKRKLPERLKPKRSKA